MASTPRRGLSRAEAAIYIGVGTTKFDELVSDGRMPSPRQIDGRKVWDIRALDAAFDDLPGGTSGHSAWDAVFPAAPSPNAPQRPARRGGRPRAILDMPNDPKAIAMLERMTETHGLKLYGPGEWEAEVRSRPMGKREQLALGQFYSIRNQAPKHIKGAGTDTTSRLEARGYIEVAEDPADNRLALYKITIAGEAAWRAIAQTD